MDLSIATAIISMLGGLAMFLYGIEVMGDGLKNSSGAALKRVLGKLTGNVVMGVLTGALVTAVIQSSTATIVLAVALIGAGVLSLKQAVSIVLGANIGTTITAWITNLAFLGGGDGETPFLLWLFDTDTLAPLALIIGIFLIMFLKSKRSKTVGDICIGFGILFVGLMNMTGGVKVFSDSPVFLDMLKSMSGSPLLGILSGLIITVIVQSSSATVAMLQSLAAETGAFDFAAVYPIIMGINIGTCIVTAFYCFVGESSRDSKRTGVVHVLFNTIGTAIFLAVLSILQNAGVFKSLWSMGVDSTIIAIFQSAFNVITAILLLPFTNVLVNISVKIVKDQEEVPHPHPELLGLVENLYISPAVALNEATKAVSAMGSIARENFRNGAMQLLSYNEAINKSIDENEECLDQFADSADHFLIGLSKSVDTVDDDRQLDMLMQTVPNFERVGDYATNLVELAQKLQEDKVTFSETAQKELKILSDAVDEILDITVTAFANNDNEAAKAIEPLEEVIDDMVMILRDRHTKRLKKGTCSVGSGLVFMEMLTYMERASDQCSSIAVSMLARQNEAIMQNHYDYLREIHSGNDAAYSEEKNRRRAQYITPLKELQ